jgi:inner membrane protein
MSPETHLLTGWLIAAYATDNPRDCRVVTLASILPDADGLGVILDEINRFSGHPQTHYYALYHHYLLHGIFGALVLTALLSTFARNRVRVALLCLIVFHLHLLCDFVGSRGPAPEDLWPIFYFGPFDKDPMWLWKHQWRLDGWQNRYFSVVLFVWALVLAERKGHSVVGVFNRRADAIFVAVLHKWRADLTRACERFR